jgi:cytochrome bd-type quinol oxidase subunit 1
MEAVNSVVAIYLTGIMVVLGLFSYIGYRRQNSK